MSHTPSTARSCEEAVHAMYLSMYKIEVTQ